MKLRIVEKDRINCV